MPPPETWEGDKNRFTLFLSDAVIVVLPREEGPALEVVAGEGARGSGKVLHAASRSPDNGDKSFLH